MRGVPQGLGSTARRRWPSALRVARLRLRRLHRARRGATMLEWCLLLAAIGIPSYFLFAMGLAILAEHYKLITTMNALPFP